MRGNGTYIEASGARHAVELIVETRGLVIASTATPDRAFWAARDIRLASAMGSVTRLAHAPDDRPTGAFVEFVDPALIAAIGRMAPDLGKRHDQTPRALAKVAGLVIVGALLSLAFLFWSIPQLAGLFTPLVPIATEQRVGELVDGQLRATLRPRASERDFVCAGRNPAGDAALARMTARLVGDGFAVPPRVAVADVAVPNAVALPGGRVYLMRGLIERARSAEEVAGILAHELGHVHHRHGMRRLLEAGALSLGLALVVGDIAGSAVLTRAAGEMIAAGHSRQSERDADRFAVDRLLALSIDPRGFGALLTRISAEAGGEQRSPLATHPFTPDRVAMIETRLAGRLPTQSILSTPEWQALRGICGRAS